MIPLREGSLATCSEGDYIVYSGGRSPSNIISNAIFACTFNGTTPNVQSITSSELTARYGHVSLVTSDSRLVVYGGYNRVNTSAPLNDVCVTSLASTAPLENSPTHAHMSRKQKRYGPPSGVIGGAFVLCCKRYGLLVGGSLPSKGQGRAIDTVFLLDTKPPAQWLKNVGIIPPLPRKLTGVACAVTNDGLFIFGGRLESGAISGEMWFLSLAFDVVEGTVRVLKPWAEIAGGQPSIRPSPRVDATLMASVSGSQLILVGGSRAPLSTVAARIGLSRSCEAAEYVVVDSIWREPAAEYLQQSVSGALTGTWLPSGLVVLCWCDGEPALVTRIAAFQHAKRVGEVSKQGPTCFAILVQRHASASPVSRLRRASAAGNEATYLRKQVAAEKCRALYITATVGQYFQQWCSFARQQLERPVKLCNFCCTAPVDCRLVPCGHICLCSTCGSVTNACTLCGRRIRDTAPIDTRLSVIHRMLSNHFNASATSPDPNTTGRAAPAEAKGGAVPPLAIPFSANQSAIFVPPVVASNARNSIAVRRLLVL